VAKSFLWKACSNALPTKANLKRRGVTQYSLCPICGTEEEMVVHVLWSCVSAKDVWHDYLTKIQKSTSNEDNFVTIFLGLQERLEKNELHLVVLVARQIWLRRNLFVFSGDFVDPTTLVRKVKE
jgi:transcription elongation factor Elf1